MSIEEKEVREYIETLPSKIIKGCKKFHELEPRDIGYPLAVKIISRNHRDVRRIQIAGKLIIITWNFGYYKTLPEEIKRRLDTEIEEAYNSCKKEIKELRKGDIAENRS